MGGYQLRRLVTDHIGTSPKGTGEGLLRGIGREEPSGAGRGTGKTTGLRMEAKIQLEPLSEGGPSSHTLVRGPGDQAGSWESLVLPRAAPPSSPPGPRTAEGRCLRSSTNAHTAPREGSESATSRSLSSRLHLQPAPEIPVRLREVASLLRGADQNPAAGPRLPCAGGHPVLPQPDWALPLHRTLNKGSQASSGKYWPLREL